MNTINNADKTAANEAAILNVLMYMDIEDVYGSNDDSIINIVSKLETIYDSPGGYEEYLIRHPDGSQSDYQDRQRQYQILKNACDANPHLANMVMDDHTMFIPETTYDEGGLEACTFTDQDGNVIVAYRGTGAGEWMDNAVAVGGMVTDSPQQKEAAKYFDYVAMKNGFNKDMNIIVTGHSKGGNKAQYVTINSKYKDVIYNCFSFDGQGMSPEAIEEFKKRHGVAAYNEARNKMYGFYADNDYVNPLAIAVIPKEHRHYFKSTIVNGIGDTAKFHYADDYLNEDGSFAEFGEQGGISKLVEKFSNDLLDLPPGVRRYAASGVMAVLQNSTGKDPVNGEKVMSAGNLLALVCIDIPVLLADLTTTGEGHKAILDILGILEKDIAKMAEENGIPKTVAITVLGVIVFACVVTALSPIIISAILYGNIIKILAKLYNILSTVSKFASELCLIIGNAILNFINGLKQWVNENINPGYKYAMANPLIKVDTDKLRKYAERLEKVNKRVNNIDDELDSLYWKVGISNLKDLVVADLLTDYSLRISQCCKSLIKTAEDFENVESKIVGQISFS